ncbi:MAG: hypothetical protein HC821_05750 [Lewinella sp.]|nr:hypothetical protein [Lewinella sp.]
MLQNSRWHLTWVSLLALVGGTLWWWMEGSLLGSQAFALVVYLLLENFLRLIYIRLDAVSLTFHQGGSAPRAAALYQVSRVAEGAAGLSFTLEGSEELGQINRNLFWSKRSYQTFLQRLQAVTQS